MSTICRVLLLVLALSVSTGVYAQPKPRWVKKGVKELNANRTNDTYSFEIFHVENPDQGLLVLDKFAPFINYVHETYNVPMETPMVLDSVPDPNNGRMSYTLTFDSPQGPTTVYGQLVDQFTQLDDFVQNKFEYHWYQLFAISNPGVAQPQFDDFTVTRHYNAGKAVAMSIIPGLGQIYKGQNVKGWIFLGTEVALVGTLIYSVERYNWYKHHRNKPGDLHNPKTTFRELMIFSAIAAGGLYVYNLFDAGLCKIAPRVEISRPNTYNATLSLSPMIAPDVISGGLNVGLGVDFTF